MNTAPESSRIGYSACTKRRTSPTAKYFLLVVVHVSVQICLEGALRDVHRPVKLIRWAWGEQSGRTFVEV